MAAPRPRFAWAVAWRPGPSSGKRRERLLGGRPPSCHRRQSVAGLDRAEQAVGLVVDTGSEVYEIRVAAPTAVADPHPTGCLPLERRSDLPPPCGNGRVGVFREDAARTFKRSGSRDATEGQTITRFCSSPSPGARPETMRQNSMASGSIG